MDGFEAIAGVGSLNYEVGRVGKHRVGKRRLKFMHVQALCSCNEVARTVSASARPNK